MFAQASDSKPKLENGAHVFVLSDTQPHIFLAVIEFIYTNRLVVKDKNGCFFSAIF